MLTFSSTAQEHRGNLGRLPDDLGQINAWRQIPAVLFERCAAIVPEKKDAMQQSMNVWTKNNGDLIDRIARLVELSVPVFAKEMSSSVDATRNAIEEASKRMIIENYFGDERFTPLQICSDYKNIVEKLSLPGTVAATRGTAYTVEADLLSRPK